MLKILLKVSGIFIYNNFIAAKNQGNYEFLIYLVRINICNYNCNKLNKIRKYITPLLLVFALFALNGSELLHHHNGDSFKSDKCQACLFNKTLNSTLITEPSADLNLQHSYTEFLTEEIQYPQQNYYISIPGRSPPSVSHI